MANDYYSACFIVVFGGCICNWKFLLSPLEDVTQKTVAKQEIYIFPVELIIKKDYN